MFFYLSGIVVGLDEDFVLVEIFDALDEFKDANEALVEKIPITYLGTPSIGAVIIFGKISH